MKSTRALSFGLIAGVLLAAYACGSNEGDVLREALPDGSSADVSTPAIDAGGDGGASTDGGGVDPTDAARGDGGAASDAADGSSDAGIDACSGIDASSDPENCGACGHSCLGGSCTGGVCAPVLLSNTGSPLGVALDDARVYFVSATADGGVYSVAKDGSDQTMLVGGVPTPQRLTVNGNQVFFTASGEVGRVDTDGSNFRVLSKTGTSGWEILVDGSEVFFMEPYTGFVRSMPIDGAPDAGVADAFAPAGSYGWSLAVSGSDLVWTARGTVALPDGGVPPADGTLQAKSKDGSGTVRIVASNQGDPLQVAADATGIYWVNGSRDLVMALPTGSSTPVVLASGQLAPWGVALDADHVYFSCRGGPDGTGFIARVRKDGTSTAAEVLAHDLMFPTTLAVDDRAVYWTNTHGGTVMKVAK